jgi:catechol 2,3-dioxygenase-like lactoylglutathione lyase family enzyme
MPARLHHVSIEVTPGNADRFGELLDAMGFDPIDSPEPLGDSVRWFDGGGTHVHLILTEGATAPALGHAAFAVTPFEQVVDAIRARGFEVEEARQLWGERRAFVLAPDGHRVEVMAAAPA